MDPLLIVLLVVVAIAVVGVAAWRLSGNRQQLPGPSSERSSLDDLGGDTAVLDRPGSDVALDDSLLDTAEVAADTAVVEPEVPAEPSWLDAPVVKPSFFDRLGKARSALTGYLGGLIGAGSLDDEAWEDLEEALIRADVGVATSMKLIETVQTKAAELGKDAEGDDVLALLKAEMRAELDGKDRSLTIDEGETNVWLFVGVNGVGKTTTIGKLGKRLAVEGHKPLMAAGDTFRAAAAEQLTMWAERTEAEIVTGAEGADPSSVIFNGVQAAAARDRDVVLADTAGRLQNKTNLMDELSKIRRVAAKEPGHVSEVLLVIDATTGQNGMSQAKVFAEAVDVTGVVLSKLDGSAKGGIVFAVESELGIPVKLVGLGEGVDDLVDFDPDAFVDALFEK
ncbi:MAG: signal recognition particle-docking protein FtsY [Acidimicrobiales bacterium]